MITQKQYSIHRACKVINLSANGYYYKPKRTDDSAIIKALNNQVQAHPEEGFWLSFHRFKNLGKKWNHKRVWRVYKQMGLSLRRKKKNAKGGRLTIINAKGGDRLTNPASPLIMRLRPMSAIWL